MKNLKISGKLTFSFGVVIALILIVTLTVTGSNLFMVSSVKDVKTLNELSDMISAGQTNYMEGSVFARAIRERSIYDENNEATISDYSKAIESYSKSISALNEASSTASDNPTLEKYLEGINSSLKNVTDYENKIKNEFVSRAIESNNARLVCIAAGQDIINNINEIHVNFLNSLEQEARNNDMDKVIRRKERLSDLFKITEDVLNIRVAVVNQFMVYNNATSMEIIESFIPIIDVAQEFYDTSLNVANKEPWQKVIDSANAYRDSFSSWMQKTEECATIKSELTTLGLATTAGLSNISTSISEDLDKAVNDASNVASFALILVTIMAVFALVVSVLMTQLLKKAIVPNLVLVTGVLSDFARGKISHPKEFIMKVVDAGKGKDEVASCCKNLADLGLHLLDMNDEIDKVAGGDLTVDIKVASEEDAVGMALKKMVDNLNHLFVGIKQASTEVSSGANQISDGAQNLAQGSTEQAATVQELSASIQEIAAKTNENAKMAGDAASLAETIKTNADTGSSQMQEMTEAVAEINKASADISKVIKVIDDIAFQTNILALNAAVEAARAGEAGKGFAVVADEVRNLASKSAAAAKETNALIENSVKKAQRGEQIASETAISLSQIIEGINDSTELIGHIAESSEEQRLAIAQINEGVEQVSEVVQRNSATAEQSAASAEELNAQSNVLADNISMFKVKEN